MNYTPRVTNEKKWSWIFLAYTFFSLGYLVSGRLIWGVPSTWPATTLDHQIPFLPQTIWLYWSQFGLLALIYLILRAERDLTITLWSMTIASCVAFAIFTLAPVHYPRTYSVEAGLTGSLYRVTALFDRPTNCFPSLHVCLATLALFGVRKNRYAPLIGVWVVSIIVSTTTTKQHYVLDVAGGFLLAVLARWLAVFLFERAQNLGTTNSIAGNRLEGVS